MKALYQWAQQHVHAPYASIVFATLVFIESFFFVPVSSLLIFYCLSKKERAFWYATLASTISIVGAITGYGIGRFLWHLWGHHGITLGIMPDTTDWLSLTCSMRSGMWLMITSLLPLPYKLLTLTAGFFKFPLMWFLVCTCTARAIKFFSIAAAINHFGDTINDAIDRYFSLLVGLGVMVLIASWLWIH